MADDQNFIKIEAQETPRGVAIADYGKDAVVLRDDLSAAELAVFAEKNAVVAFWLPANCAAKIYIEQFAEKNELGSSFSFKYEVEAASAISTESLEVALGFENPWLLYCGGEWVIKFCPPAHIAMCIDGEAVCEPL